MADHAKFIQIHEAADGQLVALDENGVCWSFRPGFVDGVHRWHEVSTERVSRDEWRAEIAAELNPPPRPPAPKGNGWRMGIDEHPAHAYVELGLPVPEGAWYPPDPTS